MGYPIDYDIVARQGATLRKRFAWSVDGTPQDLTGWYGRMEVRRKASSSAVALDVGPYISLGGDEGTVEIGVPAEVMEGVSPAKYVYDLELVNPLAAGSPEVITLFAGRFVVIAEVTRGED